MLKRLLNRSEEATHSRLSRICQENMARVFSKVRVADVLPIEQSGLPGDEFGFALRSHFDFVVADTGHLPLFAVEFNGPSHASTVQKRRDELKVRLCRRFDFPLLQIDATYLDRRYRNMDLLSWFAEVWFLQRAFDQEQAKGNIPDDVPFDPFMIMGSPGQPRGDRFPLWLSAPIRAEIVRLHKAGKCLDSAPSFLTGVDQEGNYHTLAWLRVTPDAGASAQAAMLGHRFGIILSDIVEEVAFLELHETLVRVLREERLPETAAHIKTKVASFRESYGLVASGLITGGWG